MALSLLKTSANNVNGSYTPNCLLYGYFELMTTGSATIENPTGAIDGQIFVVQITTGGSTGSYPLSWGTAYKGSGLPSGYQSVGAVTETLWFYDNGNAVLLSAAYF